MRKPSATVFHPAIVSGVPFRGRSSRGDDTKASGAKGAVAARHRRRSSSWSPGAHRRLTPAPPLASTPHSGDVGLGSPPHPPECPPLPSVPMHRRRLAEQQCSDRLRGLLHRVVGGWEVVDLPLGIGLESGAEFSERRPVLPSGAVDELATGDLGDGAGEPDRLQERGEGMGTAAGIAAAAVRRSDGVAGGAAPAANTSRKYCRSLTTSTTRRRAVRRRRDAPVVRSGRQRDRRRRRSPSRA